MSMNVRGKIEAAKMKVSIDGKITERFIDYIEIAEDTDMHPNPSIPSGIRRYYGEYPDYIDLDKIGA